MENVRTMMEPEVRPFLDLQTNGKEISTYCRISGEPVVLTEDGADDLILVRRDAYESGEVYRLCALLEEREEEIRAGKWVPAHEAYAQLEAEMKEWNNMMSE